MNWGWLFDRLKFFLFGKPVDDCTFMELKSEVRRLRFQSWLWVLVAVLVLFGIFQQHQELLSCYNGDAMMVWRNAFEDCVQGFTRVGDVVPFNFTI